MQKKYFSIFCQKIELLKGKSVKKPKKKINRDLVRYSLTAEKFTKKKKEMFDFPGCGLRKSAFFKKCNNFALLNGAKI